MSTKFKSQEQPLVSIVTVNHKNVKQTWKLLLSLHHSLYKNIELIIVDNESSFDPSFAFKEAYPDAQVVRLFDKAGYSKSHNEGIAKARGKYVFLLDNNTELTESTIGFMVEELEKDDNTGALSPKVRYSGSQNLRFAGETKINPLTGKRTIIGKKEIDQGQYDKAKEVDYLYGGAMMFRAECLKETGGFAENIDLYYSGLDWSERLRSSGYKLIYAPQALVKYTQKSGGSPNSPSYIYELTRSKVLFMKRNLDKLSFLFFCFFFALVAVPGNVVKYLLKREIPQLKAFVLAVLCHLEMAEALL